MERAVPTASALALSASPQRRMFALITLATLPDIGTLVAAQRFGVADLTADAVER